MYVIIENISNYNLYYYFTANVVMVQNKMFLYEKVLF